MNVSISSRANLFLFLVCFVFVVSWPVGAAVGHEKDACVTDKCHPKMGKEKFVHGPVAVGDCLSCHKKTGDHKFAPMNKTNEEQLCYKCHPDKINRKKGAHKQVKGGYCSQCHDPHQSPNKYQLKSK